jgi:hypothetical protein
VHEESIVEVAVKAKLLQHAVITVWVPLLHDLKDPSTQGGIIKNDIRELSFLVQENPKKLERSVEQSQNVIFEDAEADGPMRGSIVRRTNDNIFPKFEISRFGLQSNKSILSFICRN